MKIVFITPATKFRRSKIYKIGGLLSIYGHRNSIIGSLILGRILKEHGNDVWIYEELNGSIDWKVVKEADAICIYTMASNANRAYELGDIIRNEYHKRVYIGGIHASGVPEDCLKHANQVVVGEAENVILDLVQGNITSKIVHAKPVENLDVIPFPDYTLLKTPCTAANIMSSRGCPYSCDFCSTSRMFSPYRVRSAENVIKEIDMYKKIGFKYINFEDDNFTADVSRAKKILRMMVNGGLVFKETFFFGRADLANDDELLDLLSTAHLNRVLIGIESLNQSSLDNIKKKQKISDIEHCAKMLQKHHIRLIASLILGLDTDTKEDIDKSVRFVIENNAYQLQPTILTPYPRTPLNKQLQNENRIIVDEWKYYDMMNVVFKPKNMSPWDLQKQFIKALKTFYTIKSSFKIGKLFGFKYGFKRLLMSFGMDILSLIAKIAPLINNGNIYNKLYRFQSEKKRID